MPAPRPGVDGEALTAAPEELAPAGDQEREAVADRRPSGGAPPAGGLRSLLRPRLRRVDVAVAVLLAVLGFAAAVQVRSAQDDGVLASARQEDLVRILDDLNNRSERLRLEAAALNEAQRRLSSGEDRSAAALAEVRRRAQVLGVLAGTLPASGPGVHLTVDDPGGSVPAPVLLGALQELRDAGAEAIQLEGQPQNPRPGGAPLTVRAVAQTALTDTRDGGVLVDATVLRPPYRFVVVGDPATLASAVAIPGGALDDVERSGGRARVERRAEVRVTALRALQPPRYARPIN